MRWYKAPNKRLIARSGNGRFRQTTLADIDLACCETCGVIFTPTLPEGNFIDPRDMREARRFCPEHGGKK